MPLKKCSESGQSGWKWGENGKCFIGKNGKRDAIKQGIAIEGPKEFPKKFKSSGYAKESDHNIISKIMIDEDYGLGDIMAVLLEIGNNDGKSDS